MRTQLVMYTFPSHVSHSVIVIVYVTDWSVAFFTTTLSYPELQDAVVGKARSEYFVKSIGSKEIWLSKLTSIGKLTWLESVTKIGLGTL